MKRHVNKTYIELCARMKVQRSTISKMIYYDEKFADLNSSIFVQKILYLFDKFVHCSTVCD